MSWHHQTPSCAFLGDQLLAHGSLDVVATQCKRALEQTPNIPLLVFNEDDYSQIEIDFRGTAEAVVAALPRSPVSQEAVEQEAIAKPKGRGRPKLGVVPREVTLLPRHWEWLRAQPGGASVALRKLVESARKESAPVDRLRHAQNSAYRFMSVMAGEREGFEEASRALFAQDMDAYCQYSEVWPEDIRARARNLAARAMPD